jgi:hypothetical protein
MKMPDMPPNQGSSAAVACGHDFAHLGLRYWQDPAPRPGTGALTVRYYDAYFCRRCLESRLVPVEAGDRNSYEKPIEGSVPVSEDDARKLRKEHGRGWGS